MKHTCSKECDACKVELNEQVINLTDKLYYLLTVIVPIFFLGIFVGSIMCCMKMITCGGIR